MHNNVHNHRMSLAKEQYKFLSPRFSKIKLKTSRKRNAVYKPDDILNVFLEAGRMRTSVSGAVESLRTQAAAEAKKTETPARRIPNDDLVRDLITGVRPGRVQSWCDAQVDATVRRARKTGMLRQMTAVALDVTDVPYYRGCKCGFQARRA